MQKNCVFQFSVDPGLDVELIEDMTADNQCPTTVTPTAPSTTTTTKTIQITTTSTTTTTSSSVYFSEFK